MHGRCSGSVCFLAPIVLCLGSLAAPLNGISDFLLLTEYAHASNYRFVFDVGVGNGCPFIQVPVDSKLTESKLRDAINAFATDRKSVLPHLKQLFLFATQAHLQCSFDTTHLAIQRPVINVTFFVDRFRNAKDYSMRFVMVQQRPETTPTREIVSHPMPKLVEFEDSLYSVFDTSRGLLLVAAGNANRKRTLLLLFHFRRVNNRIRVDKLDEEEFGGIINSMELDPTGNTIYFIANHSLFRTYMDSDKLKFASFYTQHIFDVAPDDQVTPLGHQSFLLWHDSTAILYEGSVDREFFGLRQLSFSKIGTALRDLHLPADQEPSKLRLRLRRYRVSELE